jgi:esterase/lipase superfamily enzyme
MAKINEVMDVDLKKLKDFLKGYLDRDVYFQCYHDNIFTYHLIEVPFEEYEQGDFTGFEINVIADDMFFSNETVEQLLDKKRIGYIGVAKYKDNERTTETVAHRPILNISN